MAKLEVAFIKPEDALGSLTVTPTVMQVGEGLDPSGPVSFDEELEESTPQLGIPVRSPGLSAGVPAALGTPHYTSVLDQLWPEFDDPEERTAARLSSLLDDVGDEAQRVHLLAQDIWAKLPNYKVPESERERYDREFLAYLRRLHGYRKALADLDPESTASVAVRRRAGAGPVPDAIMHLYFGQQLGILNDHGREMSETFVGGVLDGLATVSRAAIGAVETIEEAVEDEPQPLWKRVSPAWLVAGGVALGAVVLGGVMVVAGSREREQ